MRVPVRQDPTAVCTVFDRREEEMFIWTDPAVESVSILAEAPGLWVGKHFRTGEPSAEYCIAR